jgi:hypothetical protein
MTPDKEPLAARLDELVDPSGGVTHEIEDRDYVSISGRLLREVTSALTSAGYEIARLQGELARAREVIREGAELVNSGSSGGMPLSDRYMRWNKRRDAFIKDVLALEGNTSS